MVRYVIIMMRENPMWGPLEGVGPENRDFLGPWNINERRLLSGGQQSCSRGQLPFYRGRQSCFRGWQSCCRGQLPFYRGRQSCSRGWQSCCRGKLPFYRGRQSCSRGWQSCSRGQLPFYRGHNLISSPGSCRLFSRRKKCELFLAGSVGQSLFFFKENCNFHTHCTEPVHLGIVPFVRRETIWLFATPRHTAQCIWWWKSLACHLYLSPDAPLLIPTVQLGS